MLALKYRNDPTKVKEDIKEVSKVYLKNDTVNNDDDKFRRCIICKTVVHRANYAKHLSSRKHLENEKQFEMIIPEWLIQHLIDKKPENIYNPKSSKQIAREKIKIMKKN